MPDYVPDALKQFRHERPLRQQNAPHASTDIGYGTKQQFAKEDIEEEELDKDDKLFVQQVLGTFLCYGRAVDTTMLVALGSIVTDQAQPTKSTMDKVDQFLDYAASQDYAVVTLRSTSAT